MPNPVRGFLAAGAAIIISLTAIPICAQTGAGLLEGTAAFGDWHTDRPGTRRLIRPQDLPAPDMAQSVRNSVKTVRRTDDQKPIVPNGFEVNLFASGMLSPRIMRLAPNGDIFVAESAAGQIRVLRPNGSGAPEAKVFATNLMYPFGIAFYPPGPNPQWVYIGDTDSVVRFPYQSGDQTARGPAETVVPHLPVGGHQTRDVAFSPDGKTMYVSVGSGSNVGDGVTKMSAADAQKWQADHPLGAAWGNEEGRADVLAFDPDGKNERVFATGIRNCVGLAVAPSSGTVWCSTNERDGLGDNVPTDYITRVRQGAFYGWPWYYIGANEDPRHLGERPDLKDKITVPDVLIQAHSASLGLAFYNGTQFPADYRGNIFAAEHGSWNRSKRTGYKIIRVIMKDGAPTGEYEDFATGFVVNDSEVWGRPVGVTVDKDGSLLISEDASGTIWRISYSGKAASR
ncbi:MAG: sorbosone dehydrogenase family protein [Xanthobacteraceae bacterium]|jgi:glucose/arabinose dehydrogenase